MAHPAPRAGDVQAVLDKHAALLRFNCDILMSFFGNDWLVFHNPTPLARVARHSIPARESTLVDASLGMVPAIRCMVGLAFPMLPSKVDPVLEAVILKIVELGPSLVAHRTSATAVLQQVSDDLEPLTADLQNLVADFARPINGRVNFGLLEAMIRACAWPHADLVDTWLSCSREDSFLWCSQAGGRAFHG